MSGDRIERERRGEHVASPRRWRKHGKASSFKPYTSIYSSVIASQLMRGLSGAALRIWLWANANWTPQDNVVLPVRQTAKALSMRQATVIAGIRELLAASLFTQHAPAKRPGSMGPGKGKAAVYALPHRVREHPPRFMHGDPRLDGSWRIYSDRLRALVMSLTDADARLLVCHVLPCDRAKNGMPANSNLTVRLGGKEIADSLPGMSPRTANRAAANLAALGLLKQALESEGRRPTMFWLDGDAVAGVARGSRKPAAPPREAAASPSWYLQGLSQMARKPISPNGKPSVSGQRKAGKTALRAKWDSVGALCAPNGIASTITGCATSSSETGDAPGKSLDDASARALRAFARYKPSTGAREDGSHHSPTPQPAAGAPGDD